MDASLALAGSLALGSPHVLSPLLARTPARYLASLQNFAGGAGLAYVFLYLLFELARFGAPKIHAVLPLGPDPLETLFLVMLLALLATYLLQAYLQACGRPAREHAGFAALLCTYNFLAGGGVAEEARGGGLNLVFYVTALGMHLLFNDLFLSHLAPAVHGWRWRLLLAGAPVVGCALALADVLGEGAQYLMLAALAGGTVVNVVRHELPSPREVRPLAFLAGAAVYAGLIVATWRF